MKISIRDHINMQRNKTAGNITKYKLSSNKDYRRTLLPYKADI